MHPQTDISIDLPKLQTKPLSIFHKKLHKIAQPSFPLKPTAKQHDDPARRLVQRYKTELYDSQSAKCDNEFMEFTSGENRNSLQEGLPKKKSFSYLGTQRAKEDSPTIRDYSINFRRRRLPKLITLKPGKEQSGSRVKSNEIVASSDSGGQKMELITFYPHKLSAHEISPQ